MSLQCGLNQIIIEEEFQKVSFVPNESHRILEMKLAIKLNNMKLAGSCRIKVIMDKAINMRSVLANWII